MARATALHAVGQRFDSVILHKKRPIFRSLLFFSILRSQQLLTARLRRNVVMNSEDIGIIYHAINVTIIALVMTYIINILAEQRIFDIFQLLR